MLLLRSVFWTILSRSLRGLHPWRYFGVREVRLDLSSPLHLADLASVALGAAFTPHLCLGVCSFGSGARCRLRTRPANWLSVACAVRQKSDVFERPT